MSQHIQPLHLSKNGPSRGRFFSPRTKILHMFEDHEKRLVRVETIMEITRPDGTTLRISPGTSQGG